MDKLVGVALDCVKQFLKASDWLKHRIAGLTYSKGLSAGGGRTEVSARASITVALHCESPKVPSKHSFNFTLSRCCNCSIK